VKLKGLIGLSAVPVNKKTITQIFIKILKTWNKKISVPANKN
jgi:hypothetical protein